QQHDENDFFMILRDAVRNTLQHHRFPGPRSRHNQPPLPLSYGREEVEDTRRIFRWRVFKPELLLRVERSEVIEENLVPRTFRLFVVNRLNFQQGKISFPFFRWPNLTSHHIAGAQIESADLTGRDINIVRSW